MSLPFPRPTPTTLPRSIASVQTCTPSSVRRRKTRRTARRSTPASRTTRWSATSAATGTRCSASRRAAAAPIASGAARCRRARRSTAATPGRCTTAGWRTSRRAPDWAPASSIAVIRACCWWATRRRCARSTAAGATRCRSAWVRLFGVVTCEQCPRISERAPNLRQSRVCVREIREFFGQRLCVCM